MPKKLHDYSALYPERWIAILGIEDKIDRSAAKQKLARYHYEKTHRAERRQHKTERYHTDPEFKERCILSVFKWRENHREEYNMQSKKYRDAKKQQQA